MTDYLNPSTRNGGVRQIVVPERQTVVPVDDAPFDDEQYVRVNGEWLPYNAPPIIPDTLAPKAPTGLAGSGTMAANGTSVDYELEWTAPTQNTDNSPLTDFAYYVVRWRYAGVGSVYQAFTTTETEFLLSGLVPDTDVEWSVLARDTSGNDSAWANNTINGLSDAAAPNQPSLPSLGSRLGSVVAVWDGLDFSAGAPPADFDYLEAYMSATTGGPWEPIGQLNGAGMVVVAGIPVGETRFVTFIAFDTSGNASTRSGETSIEVLGVTGPDIEANAITANMISAGELAAAVTLTGYLLAGDPGASRVVFDSAGIRLYSSTGDIRINLPTDPDVPAQFEGNAIMDALTVNDFLAIRGINNEISKGAVVALSNGTTAPTSATSLAVGYATYVSARHTDGSLFLPTGHNAALDNSEDFVATYQFFGYGKVHGISGKYYHWPERTDSEGNKRSTYNPSSGTIISVGGAERLVIAGNRCLNNGDAPLAFLTTFDLSPMTNTGSVAPTVKASLSIINDNYVWVTRIGRVFSSGSTWRDRFCLGIQQALSNTFLLKVYSATDAAITQVGSDLSVSNPLASGEGYLGVTYGDSAKLGFPGAAQSVWLIHGSVNTYAFSSAGVRIPQFDFPSPAGQQMMCAWGDSATNGFIGFRSTAWHDETPITKLTNNHWDTTTTSSKWWVSATWYDPDVTGGTHETAQSARASITMPKRAGLTFTVPTFPARPFPTTTDDVLAAKVYLARGNTDPGRVNMELAATVTSPTRSGYIGTFAFPAGAAVSPPPVSSNFPASAPAKITSADGTTLVLGGDGYATLGTFNVGLNGGTTLQKAIDLSVGDDTSTSQRFLHVLRKISTDAYAAQRFIDNSRAFGDRITKNGAEMCRMLLSELGVLNISSSPAGTADIQTDGVSLGRGIVPGGFLEVPAASAASAATTATDIAGIAVTVSLKASRRYKVTWYTHVKTTVANDRATLYIREGSTTLGFNQTSQLVTAASYYSQVVHAWIDAPTTGSHTIKGSMARLAGSGSLNVITSTLTIEDVGAAGV